jgi:hypothetical protein
MVYGSQIRELEALQVRGSSLDTPTKPPPPYVPPPAAEPYQPQQQQPPAFLVSCEEQKLIFLIESRVSSLWEPWTETGSFPLEETPGPSPSSPSTAQAFDTLVKDVIEEVIQDVLQAEPGSSSVRNKSHSDKIRLGPLTLQAQKLRLPKTKEELGRLVLERTMELVPPELLIRKKNSRVRSGASLWRKRMKWAARPRDLVDEALVEELIDEDRLWLETGPEEAEVMEHLSNSILKKALSQVIDAFRVVEELDGKNDNVRL